MDLDDIRPKAIPYRHMAFSGEIRRVGLGVLRGPDAAHDQGHHAQDHGGAQLERGRPEAGQDRREAARVDAAELRAKGIVTSDHGKGSNLRWSLSS